MVEPFREGHVLPPTSDAALKSLLVLVPALAALSFLAALITNIKGRSSAKY